MKKQSLLIGGVMLCASGLFINANAPAAATEENLIPYTTSCGIPVMGLGRDAFQFPWEYEEYKLNLNYAACGEFIMPETGTRPPTTEPDPGALGLKPGQKKK